MSSCAQANLIGSQYRVAFAAGCGDLDLATATFEEFGTINSKALDFSGNTTDNTSDLSGGVNSNLVTTIGGDITVSGWLQKTDTALVAVQQKITKYFIDETQNPANQPCGWLKCWAEGMPMGFYVFVNITQGPGIGGGTNDVITFSMTFSVTSTNINGVNAIQHFDPTV